MSAATQTAIVLLSAVAIFVLGVWYGVQTEREHARLRRDRPIIGEAEVPVHLDPPLEQQVTEPIPITGQLELAGLKGDVEALTYKLTALETAFVLLADRLDALTEEASP